jgi:hypothetical protein
MLTASIAAAGSLMSPTLVTANCGGPGLRGRQHDGRLLASVAMHPIPSLSLSLPRLQPGDWATWVGALGAFAAFLAAIWTLVLQRRANEEARRQLRREQASKIWAKMNRQETTDTEVTFEFRVINQSGQPCYFTYFEVFDDVAGLVHFDRLGTLSTEYTSQVKLGGSYRKGGGWPYFRITFMDGANLFWERDSYGYLRETSDGTKNRSKRRTSRETFAERRSREVRKNSDRIPPGVPDGISGMLPGRGQASTR